MPTILHSDLNAFYASAEQLRRPELAGKAVVVVGDPEGRRGIVLAKSAPAKACGVATGDPLFRVVQKCPDAVILPADFPYYLQLSGQVRAIYAQYTDLVEPYGIDECWLDVSHSRALFGDGVGIANAIRNRVHDEVGLTVSVGVSFNKIFAKLASDLRKPDAVTRISEENFRAVAWPRPVEELLYVGRATLPKLHRMGVVTIGDLAAADPARLRAHLGKWGQYLHAFAWGQDPTPVSAQPPAPKQVGNSLTFYRDFGREDAAALLDALAQSVSARLARNGLGGGHSVGLWARLPDLSSVSARAHHTEGVESSRAIAAAALALYDRLFPTPTLLRAIGLSVGDFTPAVHQLSFFEEERQLKLDRTVEALRAKYGHAAVQRANLLRDPAIAALDPQKEHVAHPEPYLRKP